MVAIVNVTGKPYGVNTYELKINNRLIATFEHKREDGLAECLKKASVAAEKAKWEGMAALFGA